TGELGVRAAPEEVAREVRRAERRPEQVEPLPPEQVPHGRGDAPGRREQAAPRLEEPPCRLRSVRVLDERRRAEAPREAPVGLGRRRPPLERRGAVPVLP